MILQHKELINYLTKVKEGKVKPLNRREAFKQFIREFNQEAKRQNSKWFAEVHNLDDKREEYHFLHISKRLTNGFWIFKEITTISLYVLYHESYFSFADNDYSFSEYGDEKNREILGSLPEFRFILENISSKISILYNYKSEDFNKRFGEIEKNLVKLEEKIW